MAKCTVAAIVPLYNNRETIVEAIDSVLAQTRPAEEIVVVDDGSTDGSADVVGHRFGDRVRLIRQANGGPSSARNTAIRASHADLIALLDADDRWLPARLEKQAAFMEAHAECMLSFTAHLMWHEHLGQTRTDNASIDRRRFIKRDFFQERVFISTDAVMVRRQALDTVGLFDETLRQCEDTDLWLRIMVRYGFEHLPEALAWMRRTKANRQSVGENLDRNFVWHERYFAKHRYTFGRGLRGWATWRAAYGSVLRREAGLCLSVDRRGRALHLLLRGIFMWPFVRPGLTLRCALKALLGNRLYDCCGSATRRVRGSLGK
jgi:glycosyltransferase involved in cell wall biosynthesis